MGVEPIVFRTKLLNHNCFIIFYGSMWVQNISHLVDGLPLRVTYHVTVNPQSNPGV